MQLSTKSKTAFSSVVIASIAMLALIGVSEKFQITGTLLEIAAWICFGLGISGCILGWCTLSVPLGRFAAMIGTLFIVGFCMHLFHTHSSKPSKESENKFMEFFDSESESTQPINHEN
jgi:hypothetical membrane protein